MTGPRRPPPRLLVVADALTCGSFGRWLAVVQAVPDDPAAGLLLRLTGLEPGARRDWLARLGRAGPRTWLRGTGAEARALGCVGVHWPEAEIPAQAPPGGLSCSAAAHDAAAIRRAASAGAGFVVVSPVFDAGSKEAAGMGLDAFRALVHGAPLPVLALGGIDVPRLGQVAACGAAGAAVLSAVCRAADPAAAVADLRRAAAAAWPAR